MRLFRKGCRGPGAFSDITPKRLKDGAPDAAAGWLDDAAQINAFDRLVLIADAGSLSQLRTALSHTVQSRIAAEVGKNLAALPEQDLQAALEKIVWF
jgi:protein required for attachment to host cells